MKTKRKIYEFVSTVQYRSRVFTNAYWRISISIPISFTISQGFPLASFSRAVSLSGACPAPSPPIFSRFEIKIHYSIFTLSFTCVLVFHTWGKKISIFLASYVNWIIPSRAYFSRNWMPITKALFHLHYKRNIYYLIDPNFDTGGSQWHCRVGFPLSEFDLSFLLLLLF